MAISLAPQCLDSFTCIDIDKKLQQIRVFQLLTTRKVDDAPGISTFLKNSAPHSIIESSKLNIGRNVHEFQDMDCTINRKLLHLGKFMPFLRSFESAVGARREAWEGV